MNAAVSHPLGNNIQTLNDLREQFERLPAKARAKFRWTMPQVEAAVRRLQTEPLSDELVAEMTQKVMEAFLTLIPSIAKLIEVTKPVVDIQRSALESQLRSVFTDPQALDAAMWAHRAVAAMSDYVAPHPEVIESLMYGELTPVDISKIARSEHGGLCRAQVLMMALASMIDTGKGTKRLNALAHRAQHDALEGIGALRKAGVKLELFPGETVAQRGERLLRYAAYVRVGNKKSPSVRRSKRERAPL